MWCMLAAPLMIGCDIRNMDADTRRILSNTEAIAIDQDTLGKQGNRIARTGCTEVWRKPLKGSDVAVALLNRGESEATITANWSDLKLKPDDKFQVRDLWAHKDLAVFTGKFAATVPSHATTLLRLTRNKKP